MPDLYIAPAQRSYQHFALLAADGLLAEGEKAAEHAAQMLRAMRSAGATTKTIDALKDALVDAFGDVQGGIDRGLDNEGLTEAQHQIDLSDVEAA